MSRRVNFRLHALVGSGDLLATKNYINQNRGEKDYEDYEGRTPIFYACKYGHSKMIFLLLAKKHSSVNLQDMYGWTPLHVAHHYGHKDCVGMLEVNKADHTLSDNKNRRPFHVSRIINPRSDHNINLADMLIMACVSEEQPEVPLELEKQEMPREFRDKLFQLKSKINEAEKQVANLGDVDDQVGLHFDNEGDCVVAKTMIDMLHPKMNAFRLCCEGLGLMVKPSRGTVRKLHSLETLCFHEIFKKEPTIVERIPPLIRKYIRNSYKFKIKEDMRETIDEMKSIFFTKAFFRDDPYSCEFKYMFEKPGAPYSFPYTR